MARYTISPKAEQDLKQIWREIAPHNPQAADSLLIRIFDKTALAAFHPLMGSPRPELSPSARILVEGRYVIIYEPATDGIHVVSVVYGGRDVANWLS